MYVKTGTGVRVECRVCGHQACFSSDGLAARFGLEVDPMYLPFRCHAPRKSDGQPCRSRDVRVLPDWPKNVEALKVP